MASPSGQLGKQMLRSASIFQGFTAFPIALILGAFTFRELFGPYMSFYDFFRDGLNAIMAAGIMFAVLVQLKVPMNSYVTLLFESAKSALATILWLWLLLDAAFGPWQYRWTHPEDEKSRRIARALASSILLLVLFYPSLIYSYLAWRSSQSQSPQQDEENTAEETGDRSETERTPLLS